MTGRIVAAFACSLLLFLCCVPGFAQSPGLNEMPSVIQVPAAARATANFDATAATDAYLAQIPADKMARSNAYFEGGYWMILWDFLFGVAIALLLLNTRWSARMRDFAERLTRFKPLQTLFYWTQYLIVSTILSFPLTVYEDYVREHKYGLATQTFGPWFGDQLKSLAVGLVLGGMLVTLLFGVARRLPRTWWIWGAAVTWVFLIFVILIVPIYIIPIFNRVTLLKDPKVVEPILQPARANGIPAQDVFQVDASRQTTRMSANVSGFASTMRITLNDNLLRRGSPEEIESVMGHEMGHYVLHHVYHSIMFFMILSFLFFAYLRWSLQWTLQRWGQTWQIRDITDPAIVPLVILLGSIFFFVLTPVTNTYVRMQEFEADMYGLNTSRQPDGFAQAAIHLGEFRKMNPSPLEESIFFDHPSGRNRIYAAMRWKAENLKLFATDVAGSGAIDRAESTGPGHAAP